VDTGNLVASSEGVVDFESLAIWGPFSFQSEWSLMTVNGFQGIGNGGGPGGGAVTSAVPGVATQQNITRLPGGERDLHFWGGYAQVAYTLTGEARGYDRRFGKLATNIFNVNTPGWATRRDGGGWNFGRGAWELAARYDYLDLNDSTVRGGIAQGVTLGLNWYLNNNFKFQFDYVNDWRDDKGGGVNGVTTTTGGAGSGNTPTRIQGFGIRTQIYF
jgi:phosphate-selective porin OprO/OprP